MKKIIPLYAVCLLCLTALVPLAAQNIKINKCLIPRSLLLPPLPPYTYYSGELINYQLQIGVNDGNAVDLEVVDVLPAKLGIDPTNIINPNLPGGIVASATVTGGTSSPCGGGYRFGATVTWKFTGTIATGTVFSRQVTVKAMEGETYECQQMNKASASASNFLCNTVMLVGVPPNYVTQIFLSNSLLVNIKSSSDWKIEKKSIGYKGVNVIRYKLTVTRANLGTRVGYYNLYNPVLADVAPVGAIITGVTNNPILCPALVTGLTNVGYITLCKLDVCQNWPQYFYVDVAYPCAQFPAGTNVTNCIKLKGQSPPDCNTGQAPYVEGGVGMAQRLCDPRKSINPLGCQNNWTGISNQFGGVVYNYPVAPPANVIYPPLPQGICTQDVLPAFYTTDLSIIKTESYQANHFPGCQGQYRIQVCNTGNMPITNISLVDNWPPCSYLTLLSTPTFYPNNAFSGITYGSGGIPPLCPTTINFTANSGFTLYPGDCIDVYMNYEINASTPIPTLIHNCVTVNCTGTFGPPAPLCPNNPPIPLSKTVCYDFNTEPAKAKPNICKTVQGGTNYQPEQWVRYKICVSNYGGAGLTGSLTDLIDPNLTNPSIIGYYYSPNAGSICPDLPINILHGTQYLPSTPLPAPYIPYSQLPSGLISSNPTSPWNINLPAQCSVNKFATLCLLIQAQIKPYTPSGTYLNTATLTPVGGPPIPPVTVPITVAQLFSFQTWKYVKGDLDADYNTSGAATPGSTVKFRIFILNTGNVAINDVAVGDQLVAPLTNLTVIGASKSTGLVTGLPPFPIGPGVTIPTPYLYFNTLPSPIECITKNGCSNTTATCLPGQTAPTTNIIKLNFGTGLTLLPGELLTVELSAAVPVGTPVGAELCNNAWVGACNKVDNSPTQVSNSKVCLVVKPYIPNCCPTEMQVSVVPVANSTAITYDVVGPKMLLQTNFTLLASPTVPIQEVRVTIVDKTIAYQPDAACVQCYTPYRFLGTFAQSQVTLQPALGALLLNPYSIVNKEIVYKPGAPMLFYPAQTLAVRIRLPDLQNIPCCEMNGEICLKFVFKDVNCNYCEQVVCVPVKYSGQ